eukprot:gene1984-33404_t
MTTYGPSAVERNDAAIAFELQSVEIEDQQQKIDSLVKASEAIDDGFIAASLQRDEDEDYQQKLEEAKYWSDQSAYIPPVNDKSLTAVLSSLLQSIPSVQILPRVNFHLPDALDVMSKDRKRLLVRLDMYGLEEKVVKGDGACQFRSLADQLYGTPEYHAVVRDQVQQQLKLFPDRYSAYVPGEYTTYLHDMTQDATWGDHVTLQAAADAYLTAIMVLTSYKDNCVIKIDPYRTDTDEESETSKSGPILYISFWAEVHYNSLYPKGDPRTTSNNKASVPFIAVDSTLPNQAKPNSTATKQYRNEASVPFTAVDSTLPHQAKPNSAAAKQYRNEASLSFTAVDSTLPHQAKPNSTAASSSGKGSSTKSTLPHQAKPNSTTASSSGKASSTEAHGIKPPWSAKLANPAGIVFPNKLPPRRKTTSPTCRAQSGASNGAVARRQTHSPSGDSEASVQYLDKYGLPPRPFKGSKVFGSKKLKFGARKMFEPSLFSPVTLPLLISCYSHIAFHPAYDGNPFFASAAAPLICSDPALKLDSRYVVQLLESLGVDNLL